MPPMCDPVTQVTKLLNRSYKLWADRFTSLQFGQPADWSATSRTAWPCRANEIGQSG